MTRLKPELETSRPGYNVRDARQVELIDQLISELKPSRNLDLIREVLVTAVKLAEQSASRGDLKILRTSIKEMRYAFKVFDRYRDIPKVSIFGSARSHHDHPDYRVAHQFAKLIAQQGYMVITGAGGGIMAAGNEGAEPGKSFGLNILLPFEQQANQAIRNDPKLINFNYFFTRKLFFVKESDAIVLLPGGFGTQDEGFETLTLVQTGKDDPKPIILLDHPQGSYWKNWRRFVLVNLERRGLISADDSGLFSLTDNPQQACAHICRFYRRYHSCRYVNRKRQLVIRLRKALRKEHIARLNQRFADILKEGSIRACEPFEEEMKGKESLDLPRLVFAFDQRHFGRLRQLIDAVNDCV